MGDGFSLIQVLIQGGLAGIAIVSLYLTYLIVQGALRDNTKTLELINSTLSANTEVIRALKETIDRKL